MLPVTVQGSGRNIDQTRKVMYYLIHSTDVDGFDYVNLRKQCDKKVGDDVYSTGFRSTVTKIEEFEDHKKAVRALLSVQKTYKKLNVARDPNYETRTDRARSK